MDNEQDEKNVISEAEIVAVEKPSEPTVVKLRKRRHDLYIELALFFILGILIGVAVKNEAVKKVTMGFDDYKMKTFAQDYDLNALQVKVLQAAKDAASAAEAAKSTDQTAPSAPDGSVGAPAGN